MARPQFTNALPWAPPLYGSPLHRVAYSDALNYYRACTALITALRLVRESIGFSCNAIFILPRALGGHDLSGHTR